MGRVNLVLWDQLAPLSSRAHLIVAVLLTPPLEKAGKPPVPFFGDVRGGQAHLLRLYEKLSVSGRVALSASRMHGRTEIRLAFEEAADADRVAAAVGASTAVLYGGWASERSFVFDSENIPALREVEAPRKPRRRSPA